MVERKTKKPAVPVWKGEMESPTEVLEENPTRDLCT
jgi:hypothetical protein